MLWAISPPVRARMPYRRGVQLRRIVLRAVLTNLHWLLACAIALTAVTVFLVRGTALPTRQPGTVLIHAPINGHAARH
jgi:hypothetical protein